MKTAVITYIDDSLLENFLCDFLPTLRNSANYSGKIFVLYYGKQKETAEIAGKKFDAEFILKEKKMKVSNQRNQDIVDLLGEMPVEITNVMCVDGGDIWFQDPIEKIFKHTKTGFGFVEEDEKADQGFNQECIKKIKDRHIRKNFLNVARSFKTANSGMIAGEKNKVKEVLQKVADLTEAVSQDFFALDQAVFNYVIRTSGGSCVLPQRFNFTLATKQNQFEVQEGIFYDQKGQKICVVHNCGGYFGRFFRNGRRDLTSTPVLQARLPGTFWAVTTFFNSAKYKNKLENYRKFREALKLQGIKLLTVECAFKARGFELSRDDADILVQVRTENAMWQKERLINIGMENLPDDCDKFAWLDNDIIFLNENWARETSALLENYAIVQPFSSVVRMPKGKFHVEEPEKIPFGRKSDVEGLRSYGFACRVAQLGRPMIQRRVEDCGLSGFAWAARREIFSECGLFDKCVYSPAGDLFMACFFYNGANYNGWIDYNANKSVKKALELWAKKVRKKINNSVYFAGGTILHLWHGNLKNRNYSECRKILLEHGFDPEKDIKKDASGCWTWNSLKPKMHEAVEDYYYSRNEEGSVKIKIRLMYKKMLKLKKVKQHVYFVFDRMLGLAGIAIRKISPEFYTKIKKTKSFAKEFLSFF